MADAVIDPFDRMLAELCPPAAVRAVEEAQRAFENHFLRLEPPRDSGANSVRQRQENKICKAQAVKGRRKGHADSRGY